MGDKSKTVAWEWTVIDVAKWQVQGSAFAHLIGLGNSAVLRNYKDAWVRYHRRAIRSAAAARELPEALLAGVCWIEVGGDPDSIDGYAYEVRKQIHTYAPHLAKTLGFRRPELTSVGDVSIQLRRAAEAYGQEWRALSPDQQEAIAECLDNEPCNISVVARHLAQLKQIDFSHMCANDTELIRIVGARYNRGPDLSLEQIRMNTSYGDFILNMRTKLKALLDD